MKIKKFLSRSAEEDRNSLQTEKDKIIQREITSIAAFEISLREKQHKRKLRIWASVVSALVVLAIGLAVFLSQWLQRGYYLSGEKSTVESTIKQLNDELKGFQFSFDLEKYNAHVNRTYDPVNLDTLYYNVFLTRDDSMLDCKLLVVVNKHYKNDSILSPINRMEMLFGYELHYTLDLDSSFGINMYSALGEMKIQDEYLYITSYSEMTLDDESVFLDFMREIISIK